MRDFPGANGTSFPVLYLVVMNGEHQSECICISLHGFPVTTPFGHCRPLHNISSFMTHSASFKPD